MCCESVGLWQESGPSLPHTAGGSQCLPPPEPGEPRKMMSSLSWELLRAGRSWSAVGAGCGGLSSVSLILAAAPLSLVGRCWVIIHMLSLGPKVALKVPWMGMR